MFEPINDGIDHINIYSGSRTILGRNLSNFADSPFDYEPYGHFRTVEGFWYWYFTGQQHDSFRRLVGYKAKEKGKLLKFDNILKDRPIIDDEKNIILGAIRCKLRQNQDILNMLVENNLPLTHYYYYGDVNNNPKIIVKEEYSWITDEYIRIRNLMINKK